MMHLVQLCFCSNFDIFFLHSATLWSVLALHQKQTGCDFHQAVSRFRVRGAWGLPTKRGGSGDENSCLLWLVAASAHSGKSVELEPSCESPRGNKSFLTSPLTHCGTESGMCFSPVGVCECAHMFWVYTCSSVCECRSVYAAGSVFYSTPWNNGPLLRMGCFMLCLNEESVQTIAYCMSDNFYPI